jgi:hypothetical protein
MVLIKKKHDETDKVEDLAFETLRAAARHIATAKGHGGDESWADEVEETLRDLNEEYDEEHTYTVYDARREMEPVVQTGRPMYVMLVPFHWSSGATIVEAFEGMQDQVRSNSKLEQYLKEPNRAVLMKLPGNWTSFGVTDFGSVTWTVPEGEPVGQCQRFTYRHGVGWVKDESR